jgi:hypothetical protein
MAHRRYHCTDLPETKFLHWCLSPSRLLWRRYVSGLDGTPELTLSNDILILPQKSLSHQMILLRWSRLRLVNCLRPNLAKEEGDRGTCQVLRWTARRAARYTYTKTMSGCTLHVVGQMHMLCVCVLSNNLTFASWFACLFETFQLSRVLKNTRWICVTSYPSLRSWKTSFHSSCKLSPGLTTMLALQSKVARSSR